MRISYDDETDSLYIHLSERGSVQSIEIAPGCVIDLDLDGRIIGLDIDFASRSVDLTTIQTNLPVQATAQTREPLTIDWHERPIEAVAATVRISHEY